MAVGAQGLTNILSSLTGSVVIVSDENIAFHASLAGKCDQGGIRSCHWMEILAVFLCSSPLSSGFLPGMRMCWL